MFNNWFWSNDEASEDEWEEVQTVEVSFPFKLMLRENTFAVENEEGDEHIDIEGDDYLIMYRNRDVTFEKNDKGDIRGFFFNLFDEREYLEDQEVEGILADIDNQEASN